MKKYKTIDLFINIALIICFAVYWLIQQDDSFFLAYFVVGGWQVISMIFHTWHKCFTHKKGSRYIYNWITLVTLATLPLGSYWILLFTAPFMAIYYTYLCYREVYVKMQRPLAVLR